MAVGEIARARATVPNNCLCFFLFSAPWKLCVGQNGAVGSADEGL